MNKNLAKSLFFAIAAHVGIFILFTFNAHIAIKGILKAIEPVPINLSLLTRSVILSAVAWLAAVNFSVVTYNCLTYYQEFIQKKIVDSKRQ